MNIFLSFFQSPRKYPIPAYDFWPYYIKNGIEESGHRWSECPEVDWALGIVLHGSPELANWRADAWEKTIAWLKKHPADIFLSYLYPHQIDLSAIGQIQHMGIPCVNFYCDHLREFKQLPVEFSGFNLNWVPEHKAVDLYLKAGYPYRCLPMPIWVQPGHRTFQPEINEQVSFIGSRDIQRQLLLENIVKRSPEIDLAIYGSGWQGEPFAAAPSVAVTSLSGKLLNQFRFLQRHGTMAYYRKVSHKKHHSPLSEGLNGKIRGIPAFEQYNMLSAGSQITMGINRYPSFHFSFLQPDSYSRLRDIEAPMLGACYLTEWTVGIEELYIVGKEIETYRDEAEFVEKVKALQGSPSLRKALKINGQKRALQDHSIPATLKQIIHFLNINTP